MEKYENIMKLVDDKLAENERTINYYREESDKWSKQIAELTHDNEMQEQQIASLEKVIKELKEELDFWKPKNEKRSNMVEGVQAK